MWNVFRREEVAYHGAGLLRGVSDLANCVLIKVWDTVGIPFQCSRSPISAETQSSNNSHVQNHLVAQIRVE